MSALEVHPGAHVHPEARIGTGTSIGAGAVIGAQVQLGVGCVIDPGAVIGLNPFSVKAQTSSHPIVIADGVRIGAGTTIQYGLERSTQIGKGTWVFAGCAIGHDVWIGSKTQIGLASTISGHSQIGDGVLIGPGCTLNNRSEVGSGAIIGIGSLVLHPVADGETVMGRPAIARPQYIEEAKRLKLMLQIDAPSRKMTGQRSRIGRILPLSVRRALKGAITRWKI